MGPSQFVNVVLSKDSESTKHWFVLEVYSHSRSHLHQRTVQIPKFTDPLNACLRTGEFEMIFHGHVSGVYGRAASCCRWLGSAYLLRSSSIVSLTSGLLRTYRRACCISAISQENWLGFSQGFMGSGCLLSCFDPSLKTVSPNLQPKGLCVVGS